MCPVGNGLLACVALYCYLFSSALKMEVGDYPERLGPTIKLQGVISPEDSNLICIAITVRT